MTRDEHREKCIEAMERAIISAIIDTGGTIDVPMRPVAVAALDARSAADLANQPEGKP